MSDKPPEIEDLDRLLPKGAVHEVKKEPVEVAKARISQETYKFFGVITSCLIVILTIIIFLILKFDSLSPEAQGKIVTALCSLLAGALGVIIGRMKS